MKQLLFLILFLASILSVFALDKKTAIEKYDALLVKSANQVGAGLNPVVSKENKGETIPVTWSLGFEHNKLPVLDGIWILKKKSVKRYNAPTKFRDLCESKLPFEENEFEHEVVISPQGEDFFVIRSLYPVAKNSYSTIRKIKDIEYQNNGMKAVIIPGEITYTYNLQIIDPLIQYPQVERRLNYKGKMVIDSISKDRIAGHGYELQHASHCNGHATDEIEFEIVRKESSIANNKTSP